MMIELLFVTAYLIGLFIASVLLCVAIVEIVQWLRRH